MGNTIISLSLLTLCLLMSTKLLLVLVLSALNSLTSRFSFGLLYKLSTDLPVFWLDLLKSFQVVIDADKRSSAVTTKTILHVADHNQFLVLYIMFLGNHFPQLVNVLYGTAGVIYLNNRLSPMQYRVFDKSLKYNTVRHSIEVVVVC